MRKALFSILFLMALLPVLAQTHAYQHFYTMPDSVCPHIDQRARFHLLLRQETTNEPACLKNIFDGVTCLEYRSNKYVRWGMSEDGITYEILCENDSTFLFITTACAPICSSVVKRYNSRWTNEQLVTPPIEGQFVKAEVQDGKVVYSDQTPEEWEKGEW